MVVKENLFQNLPADLIIEIFSRLPSKSIARFRCLSKQWTSILALGSPYFTRLFLTQSKTRPRLLFAVQGKDDEWFLYSCPQPQISYKNSKSSLSVTEKFHMSLPKSCILNISASILGLIYCYNMPSDNNPMLCNPTTRNLLRLPQLTKSGYRSYFGYDPINKQFSFLSIGFPATCYELLNLGSEKQSWRNIEGPLDHYPLRFNICINGILYYIANFGILKPRKIACFDFNSEEFKFIDEPWSREPKLLVNFKGKLGGITTEWVEFGKKKYNFELTLWVLEDRGKQEWSKHVYILPLKLGNKRISYYSIVGMTVTCEVVLFLGYVIHPFYVYFCNLENNIIRKVEIKGFEGFQLYSSLHCCLDYVEDLKKI